MNRTAESGAGIPACGWPVAQAGMPVPRFGHLAALCLLLAAGIASAQTGAPRGVTVRAAVEAGFQGDYDPARMHAIVIGVDAYRHWPKLRCAVNDARSVANTLYRHYGFPTNQIKLLLDGQATRRGILRALDGALALRDPDNLLIYYAGHGWQDQAQNGFWVPVDADEGNKFDYISNNEIVGDYFKKYGVKHLLVVVDSCFSGAMLRGSTLERPANWRLPAGFQKPSRLVLTSGDLQPVPDGTGDNSPFALRFLQHLRYADQPAYGVQDLHVFIRRNLNTESICAPLDTPRHMPGGELILCRLETPLQPENVFLDFGPGGTAVVRQPPAREPSRKGGLFVETVPVGALVKAGGHDIQRSPFTFRNLPAGPLTVTVELADHDTETRQVTVPADDFATLTLTLKRQQGRISVESDPPRAEIWIGGQKVGETPKTLTLDVGSVALTLKRDGYEDQTVSVQVRSGQTASTGAVALEQRRGPVEGRPVRIDDLGMDLLPVGAGSFQMGSNDGSSDEKPVRTVRITRDFWMGKYEVTNGQYQQFVREAGYDGSKEADSDYLRHQRDWDKYASTADTHPIVAVSWNNAVAFCRWLTERERRANRLPSGYVYRLPTEAEWEYAARGGAQGRNTQYAGSDNLDSVAWYDGNSGSKTQRVGTKAANELGLHDMSGNVWEWCLDWYQDSYNGLGTSDPTGPANGSDRVFRGGSWYGSAAFCRVACRSGVRPSLTRFILGFRVVLAPVP